MKMTNQETLNPELQLAEQFALYTGNSFFLTGKAGTGKTTLLKKITGTTHKKVVVVAPTGVAAIHAGGTTIHSMFNLPLSSFIPSSDHVNMNLVMNRRMLASHFRFSKDKRRVIQEMEMLVIDEVSMVRCDVLDAIDFTLRMVRKKKEPFGGVQVILIGDLHQLPPVVRDNEWEILKKYYAGPYFFNAEVWKIANASHIELKKIYRQKDEVFIRILNNIRNRQLDPGDYKDLESRYHPSLMPAGEGYVLLSTHNKKADQINDYELNKLSGKLFTYQAIIEGEFFEQQYPCDSHLKLRKGAQVMFIKNDAENGSYYNGKLAEVYELNESGITVIFNDTKTKFQVHRENWENINYRCDEITGSFAKKVMGTFSQYPLRLAWAITIHKSQGLTFDKVIIDAGASFAAGQVYVALSRCRSLEGIILHSRIHESVLFNDDRINSFTASPDDAVVLENILPLARKRYAHYLLNRLFIFDKPYECINEWEKTIEEMELPGKNKIQALCRGIMEDQKKISSTAEKFHVQLNAILDTDLSVAGNLNLLKERCYKAIEYFTGEIFNNLITPLHNHIQDFSYKSKVKKYIQQLQVVEELLWDKINKMYQAEFFEQKLYNGELKYKKTVFSPVITSVTTKKKQKGGTFKDTLDLHMQGKNITEIAEIRGLTESTIKGHIAKWIMLGEIDIHSVLTSEKIESLVKLIKELGADNFAAINASQGGRIDYGELKMVSAYLNFKKDAGLAEPVINSFE